MTTANMTFSDIASYLKVELNQLLPNCSDLVVHGINSSVAVCYVSGLVDTKVLSSSILSVLTMLDEDEVNTELIRQTITICEIEREGNLDQVALKLLQGHVYIAVMDEYEGLLCNIANFPARAIAASENETVIFGPVLGFNESLSTNIAVLRSYIKDPGLVTEPHIVGNKMETRIQLTYMADFVDEKYIDYVKSKLKQIKTDGLMGNALLMQKLQNHPYTIFPLMTLTERPDRTVQALMEGKVVIFMEGDSHVIIGPSSFIDFFISVEDRYMSWGTGLFIRMLRFVGLTMSVFLTPIYVAALTFHYQMIPPALIVSLIETRSKVPFPPLLETLLLEITMELLREAGVRLPTKVCQTIGIVGGIVIGQAAVQAGFTSNILIMLVALAALGSFTTPNYLMGSSIRLIRYPMIIMAGMWGILGIVFVAMVVFIHLLRQTSMGRPYLFPIIPFRRKDLTVDMLLTPKSHYSYRVSDTKSSLNSKTGKDQQSNAMSSRSSSKEPQSDVTNDSSSSNKDK
ncbi:spore germination protein [Paenibacillus sp. SC116]|uniref:spore germination protein n=1 Tax=Paenibacillus sp. SC116 TaxID=2968986 RepID=UPI00215B70B6|nr:spore germination protein [Paenibacillus sp. SC116]MCR8843891.1 spore germination protein [Paenibacillus sp. SC116]